MSDLANSVLQSIDIISEYICSLNVLKQDSIGFSGNWIV